MTADFDRETLSPPLRRRKWLAFLNRGAPAEQLPLLSPTHAATSSESGTPRAVVAQDNLRGRIVNDEVCTVCTLTLWPNECGYARVHLGDVSAMVVVSWGSGIRQSRRRLFPRCSYCVPRRHQVNYEYLAPADFELFSQQKKCCSGSWCVLVHSLLRSMLLRPYY